MSSGTDSSTPRLEIGKGWASGILWKRNFRLRHVCSAAQGW